MARELRQRMIENYIYFYHLNKFCILPLYPDEISDAMPSSFKDTNALSRSAPVWSYINSGPRQVSVNFQLHRDLMNDLNKDVSTFRQDGTVEFPKDGQEDYIDILIRNLQSISFPKYQHYADETKCVTPPMVAIRLGSTFFIKGVVNGGVTVTYKKPINEKGQYMQANIQFSVYEVEPYDAETIAKVGSFRGVSSGNNIYKE